MKPLFSIIFVLLFAHSFAQDTIWISSVELEQKKLANNLQIKLAKSETHIAQAELLAAKAMYLPNITASYTFTNTNNPLYAFGNKLNQERVTMADFDPLKLNNPNALSSFGTKIEVQQPIINIDAVYQKKAGQIKTNALKIKEERTTEHIELEVKKAYMMLQLAYKMHETLENAKKTTLENKKVTENYYQNGMIQKTEVLYIDVRLKEIENQIAYAKSNIQNASDHLFFLLNEDATNKIIKPSEELEYNTPVIDKSTTLNLSRKDLQAYQKSLGAYDLMVKSSKAKFLPRLNAFGSWEMYDNKIAQFNASGYLVGLQLSWNIFDGLKSKSDQAKHQAERAKAKTEIEQYTQQSQLELNKAYRQMEDADNKVQLAKLAFEQSREAYRIRKNRYEQGLEKSSDILMSEATMSQKDLEYQQAVFEHNTAIEYYNFLKK